MVHALEHIHRLLKPDGLLIDIHPLPEGALVTAYHGGSVIFSEREHDDESEDVLAAERALKEVLRRGLYVRERDEQFEFLTHASSVAELRDFLEEASAFDDEPPEPAQLAREEQIYARVEQAMREAGANATVALVERSRMARLRPLGRSSG